MHQLRGQPQFGHEFRGLGAAVQERLGPQVHGVTGELDRAQLAPQVRGLLDHGDPGLLTEQTSEPMRCAEPGDPASDDRDVHVRHPVTLMNLLLNPSPVPPR